MFQRPGAKARSNAEEQRTNGIQTEIVWASFVAEPSPPAKRMIKVSIGGAPAISRIRVVKTKERKSEAADRPRDEPNLAVDSMSYTALPSPAMRRPISSTLMELVGRSATN